MDKPDILIGSWCYLGQSVPIITISESRVHTQSLRILLDLKPPSYREALFYLYVENVKKGKVISRKLQKCYSTSTKGNFGWWHEKPEGKHLIIARQVIRSAIIGGYGEISSKDKDLLKDILKKL